MAFELKINVAELRTIINKIFDHIEYDLSKREVVLKYDAYWDVPDNVRHNFTSHPSGYSVGQLSEDWDFLRPILEDKDQAVALMLIHVAPILRCLGEEVGQ